MEQRSATASHRRALSYIDKSREFYAAHGYDKPYQWAVNDDSPFQPLSKPLDECRVAVVTTAFPVGTPDPKETSAVLASPTPDAMFTNDLSWHKEATNTDDVGSFLPLDGLHDAAATGRIGSVGPRFYCVPTLYSQRLTTASARQVAEWCKEDDVDLLLLTPL